MRYPTSLSILLSSLLLLSSFTAHSEKVLTDIDGKQITLSSLNGKWLFINYWASWCDSCVNEISELNKFSQQKSNKVKLVAYNYDALPIKDQKQLVKQYNIKYDSLKVDPSATFPLGDITGVPLTFVISPEGKLHKKLFGPQTVNSLTEAMK